MALPSNENISNALRAFENLFNFTESRKTDPITTEALHLFQSIMTGIWIIISVSGICTNFFNLRTFLRMGLEDSVTISFYALSMSDFTICSIALIELLAFLCYILEREYQFWLYLPPIIPTFFCMCVRRIFTTITILITTFLAIQRCLCVVIPFHVRGLFTKFRTRVYLVIILTFSIICYGLFISAHTVVTTENQIWNATQLVFYIPPGSGPYLFLMEVVIGIGLNIACQLIVMVCLVVMGLTLRKTVKFRKSATIVSGIQQSSKEDQPSEKVASKETQAIIQVALVSIIFVSTNCPYLGYGITNILMPEFGVNDVYHNLFHLSHNMMFTVELINSSLNFVVYYKYNSKFKSTFSQSSATYHHEKNVVG